MSSRTHTQTSLPAPVVHAGFSVSQSKSHVLAGVQDAYWSDDEAEDAECPLCLEEMDISDLNFKPCICGYQVCRFCWHHIKENLNGRCPACRRVYTDDAVEFKPIAKDDHKRLTQQKKQRERERKELDALGRRKLVNVRVVQRNVVYVVGMGPRFAKEELIPTLRSNEYFGQYGKISKILLVKRTPSGGGAPVVGVYITFHRREDAARAIAAVDGTVSPGGGREIMRASFGTTKYCMAFLRGQNCGDHGCMNLHEWGDEKDCFTKEDLTTLKHTMKASESRRPKKGDEINGLPRAAAWGHKGAGFPSTNANNHVQNTLRQARRGGGARQQRTAPSGANESRRVQHDRAGGSIGGATKTPSQASSSRPTTPANFIPQRPATPSQANTLRHRESQRPPSPRSPTSSVAVESDVGSGSQEIPMSPPPELHHQSTVPLVVPPAGPSAPPGISAPSRPPRVDSVSPQTPLLASQSSYQMSTAARALLDEVKGRRETLLPSAPISPFPDLDKTLNTLSGEGGEFGGFSFNLDPKLAGQDQDDTNVLHDFNAEVNVPFQGSFTDAFPALRPPSQGPPCSLLPHPGLSYGHSPSRSIYDPMAIRAAPVTIERQSTGGSSYTGAFNPFAEPSEDLTNSPSRLTQHSPLEDDSSRKVSRFGFARGRQGSTAASSPMHMSSPLTNSDSHASFYHSADPGPTVQSQWMGQTREYAYSQSGSSPMLQHAQVATLSQHQPQRFQPFGSDVSEAQLREMIQSSRGRRSSTSAPSPSDADTSHFNKFPQQEFVHQPFNDPAVMSAQFSSMTSTDPGAYSNIPTLNSQMAYGPPPGLSFPHHVPSSHSMPASRSIEPNRSTHVSTSPTPSVTFSSSDFPALNSPEVTRREPQSPVDPDDFASGKAARKAAKKAAAAEKAAERQKIAQEKAAIRAAEKAKIAAEKAAEKERKDKEKTVLEQALKVKAEAEQKEKSQIAEEMAEKVKAARDERERAVLVEKEKFVQAKKVVTGKQVQKGTKRGVSDTSSIPLAHSASNRPANSTSEPVTQTPLLSKKPKKNKPVTKPIRIPKEDDSVQGESSTIPSASAAEPPHLSTVKAPTTTESSSNNSRAASVDRTEPTTVEELLEEIDTQNPTMDLPNHPFFDLFKVNPAAKMPLEYGPLVHALSALSVGGGSFANNMPSGSIDNAVSSFQQLLETLTQTISDLLRLLPRTTWDDSSSFDGVLRDMLKGDDFLDDASDDNPGKEDEVAALTLALERRARWMEVQLSKLEELHRDINTAAVRAVLSFNDNGWDRHGFMPRVGNTLRRFDNIGMFNDGGNLRPMTSDELEKKLAVAREAAVFAEVEFREVVEKMQAIRPVNVE